jgi:hypothetical protein
MSGHAEHIRQVADSTANGDINLVLAGSRLGPVTNPAKPLAFTRAYFLLQKYVEYVTSLTCSGDTRHDEVVAGASN